MDPIMEERFRKLDIIIKLYENRENTHEVIAEKLGMSAEDAGIATRLAGYSHTKKTTSDNANPGQLLRAIIKGAELAFLDKYDF